MPYTLSALVEHVTVLLEYLNLFLTFYACIVPVMHLHDQLIQHILLIFLWDLTL